MTDHPITLSLVLATKGRVEPIGVFLNSLSDQDMAGVEVIIVDQNADGRVTELLASRADSACIRRVVSQPGVSRARNIGAAAATGTVLGFPDDDCWYPPQLLNRVRTWFGTNPDATGLSCRVSDESGRASAGGFMSGHAQVVTRRNVWRSVVSPGLFVKRLLHNRVGGFDECLGVGAGTPWGSAEETDYVLRALDVGARIHYCPEMTVIHPRRAERLCTEEVRRGWRYGRGVGHVLARHGAGPGQAMYFACLPIASAGLATVQGQLGRACARLGMSAGRFAGWCQARWHGEDAASNRTRAANQGVTAP